MERARPGRKPSSPPPTRPGRARLETCAPPVQAARSSGFREPVGAETAGGQPCDGTKGEHGTRARDGDRRRARGQRGGLAARAKRRGRRPRRDEAARRSPAHVLDGLAELVCSNSLRSDNPQNAVGLLHEELRRLGSLVLSAADATRAGRDALAVDRERFSSSSPDACAPTRPGASARRSAAPPGRTGLALVATGPLTGDALAADIAALAGGRLHFYDALAPIVAADSVDMSIAYARTALWQGRRRRLPEPAVRRGAVPRSWPRSSARRCAPTSSRSRATSRAACRSR